MRVYLQCFLLLLVLLSGCQSSRPAFYCGFRPAPPASAASDSAYSVTLPVAAELARPQPAAPATPETRATAQLLAVAPDLISKQPAAGQRRQAAPQSAHTRWTAVRSYHPKSPLSPRHQTSNANDLFFLGGLALVGIGLAAGLVIGGWPGLLIGLALGIPGYLFLGRGYAGSWKSTARTARQSRSLRPFHRVAAVHPTDGIDALGRFLVKVTVVTVSIFLATLILGLVLGSSTAALIGGVGLALVGILAILLFNF